MRLTAAGWKTPGKYWGFKWSFAMTTGAWCLLINRCGREEKGGRKKKAWVTETCQTALTEISKKSQSLRHRTRAQIACGIRYKRFGLKRFAFDIKEEKLGQFSICCGGKRGSSLFFFFDKGGGQSFVSLTPTVNSWEDSLSRSVWASSILQRARSIGCWIYITKDPELSQQVKV